MKRPFVLRAIAAAVLASAALSGALAGCSGGSGDSTPVESCPTLPTTCPSPPPSWKSEVEPLVKQYCLGCHGPGGVETSAHDFTTYQGVASERVVIGGQLQNCPVGTGMPPPDAGQPTETERGTIFTWALLCGAPNN